MPGVKIREGESLPEALRRFKRECEREGLMSEIKKREFYESRAIRKKRKAKEATRKRIRRLFKMRRFQGKSIKSKGKGKRGKR